VRGVLDALDLSRAHIEPLIRGDSLDRHVPLSAKWGVGVAEFQSVEQPETPTVRYRKRRVARARPARERALEPLAHSDLEIAKWAWAQLDLNQRLPPCEDAKEVA
jgi:hypothetical protein